MVAEFGQSGKAKGQHSQPHCSKGDFPEDNSKLHGSIHHSKALVVFINIHFSFNLIVKVSIYNVTFFTKGVRIRNSLFFFSLYQNIGLMVAYFILAAIFNAVNDCFLINQQLLYLRFTHTCLVPSLLQR